MSDILGQLLIPDSIEIFLKTNPAFISHIIRSITEQHDIEREIVDEIVEAFLAGCISEIKLAGITCFGFDAIIDAMHIAETMKKEFFLSELRREMEKQLFSRHPDFFCSIIHMFPSFVVKLIDLMPDAFVAESHLYVERMYRYELPESVLEYIQIVRKLFYLSEKRHVNKRRHNEIFHVFERLIDNNEGLNRIDLKKLKIEEIDDLLWYAKITGNSDLMQKIEAILPRVPVRL